jgi:protein-disulfide isomerase
MAITWKKVERTATITMALCAVAVSAITISRQARDDSPSAKVEKVKNWVTLANDPFRIGSPTAPVQIAAFMDYQCPFCRSFFRDVSQLMREYPADVAFVFLHLPLRGHAVADLAARGAKCAGEQGRFSEYSHVVFGLQDSLSTVSWKRVATDASIGNHSNFLSCLSDSASSTEAERYRARAREFGVRGTPTVLVNGWRYPVTPTLDSLRAIVKRSESES